MSAYTDEFVTVDGVELHYTWGDAADPPVVCVHGLSRVGRDFGFLCERLSGEYRLLCPDMPGRGLSEWADGDASAEKLYTGTRMAELLVGFFDELGLKSARYVGTSMGGQLGIALAAGPLADRISHLIINDVGPAPADDEDAQEGIDRIIEYLTDPPTFDRLTDLEAYYRETYATFSDMTDAEWRVFTVGSSRRTSDGQFIPAYDPRIVEPLLTEETDVDPWAAWTALDQPTLVLKGEHSDILADATFERMRESRPDIETSVYDCGHAPSLNVSEQVGPIREVLAR